jgi:hypothetical protein
LNQKCREVVLNLTGRDDGETCWRFKGEGRDGAVGRRLFTVVRGGRRDGAIDDRR